MPPMAAASGLVRRASRTARAHLPWGVGAVGRARTQRDVDPVQPSSSLSLATTTDGDE